MPRFLILRLDGPMQAWGTHTFEDLRPSNLYPTRSGLLGLLAACLGIERSDHAEQAALAASVEFSVRVDIAVDRPEHNRRIKKPGVKLPDFHTVMDARKVDGKVNKFPVVSRREYLFDAAFTVAVGARPNATVTLEVVADALRRPLYTPTLGRRACPPARPLLDSEIEAADGVLALRTSSAKDALIYSDSVESGQALRLRDVPLHSNKRQFGTRLVYLHRGVLCS
ncbi:type I-E CRISPR-associated protein Cas5/CasD [Pseudomethylobacillus aquaticus]|uniref:Type I-E CRISPR-associated protein Cas5/CasD n=2 Tax=Pseudomethylobacillus aquaticus TaxID=2676064 RepID=A0A3N0UVN4_9PROT|nr:type I-E CRISPR-associated protein Cas5/CasD [Pseudomethylobacillus aquaticus]ROH84513.1 type I-E CRISPR-associated protein Cas5/CasD [Pseudomethylobacillus aquaticus]